jgi:predicted nuclease with TOPRIM domain
MADEYLQDYLYEAQIEPEELTEEISRLEAENAALKAEVLALEKERHRLITALEFYADKKTWITPRYMPEYGVSPRIIALDAGDKARAALEDSND